MSIETQAGTDSKAASESQPWTIGRLINWTSGYLARHGVDEARLAGEVLLAHAAGCRRIDLYARFDAVLEELPLAVFRARVKRAAQREPIAYLVEHKEFFSLSIHVTRDVLIPRPETEVLVECVLDHCARTGLTGSSLLDLGTGSGCVAVALLKQMKHAQATATDISEAALAVAKSNGDRHGVSDRLILVQADRLSLPAAVVPDGGFDVLISNPPYVAQSAMDGLDPAVRDHEPHVALTDGEDGLSFYRSIAADGPTLLKQDGAVLVEVGDDQADAVIKIMEQAGGLVHRRTRRDRVVGWDRVLMFTKKS